MKKSIVLAVMTLMLTGALASSTYAQEWPQKPIRVIVSFGPGGGADIIGRILADSMQAQLGKPMVVENKPGAGGIIGNEAVANADPDGYTLGIMTAGQIIAAVTRKNMRYDTLTAFAPIGQIATASLLIVTRPDFPPTMRRNWWPRRKPIPARSFSPARVLQPRSISQEKCSSRSRRCHLLHVPFKTSPEAINATLGKHADVLFDTVSALIGHVQSGQLKALAVTGKDRFPAVPDIPAATEFGVLPGYDVTTWYGLFAPRGTPPAVVAKLNKTLNDSLADQTVRERLATRRCGRQGVDA